MNEMLNKLAAAVSDDEDLETLVKSLLELLEAVTGLESTYLTSIDTAKGVQRIVFARNSKNLSIPEGLTVSWGDTLCKRAIDEGQLYTDNVRYLWGDSEAAKTLGLVTYVSEPVHIGDNELYGTLCGASRHKVKVSDEARRLLAMFSRLIARQLERDQLLATLRREHITLQEYARSDPLTGIPNRRAMDAELKRSLANADRGNGRIHLAFIDLDGFKSINDDYGHDAGDRFLIEMAKRIKAGLREGDFIARIGGDEFVVFGTAFSSDYERSRIAIRQRLEALSRGTFHLGMTSIDYEGASVGVVTSEPGMKSPEALLARADDAMYQVKRERRKHTAELK
ncbi:diguanylate cyclase [Marinobacter vulgaris]|uniref:diguanylate cyclase n=1 Tax=Marinobacter vulgaris TaxID=1928331 RepID=A0A2V4A032_9GAMM|nr:sensor domain-containing diguanylate cyclase [Marinobacter vulgaris]PXX91740.1 diguanylate cyclase [Marinobacter vulgaris]TSJ70754.1 sensor domain-containing diguanylate cyclase [Marinobacter vulgaris]